MSFCSFARFRALEGEATMDTSTYRPVIEGHGVAELTAQVESLQLQLRRSQRMATVGMLMEMVAHEFNNILTPMLNCRRLVEEADEAARERLVRRAYDAAVRASTICDALLDLARPAGEELQRVVLAELVSETLTAMARDPAKDHIRLDVNVPANIELTTRPVELKQVLLNLLLNAREAVLSKRNLRSIVISAETVGREVFLRVADTGPGIPPENLERVFEPLFTTRAGGTGLGLAVCRHIVQNLHGRIGVRSELGRGTCFTVVLPIDGGPHPDNGRCR